MQARPYSGFADLRRMQRLVQDAWALVGSQNNWHVGDLAWQTTQHVGREPEWRRQLWEENGRVAAYGWLRLPGTLDWQVDPRRPELVDEVLAWFEAEAQADALEASTIAHDAAGIESLRARGYEEVHDAPWFAFLERALDDVPDPQPPAGYTLRTVCQGDLDARVAVHRAAFHPSRVTTESYANVMRAWPYRADLDCVAEATDGTFAAYTLCWYDDENRVGELEPVGTHPDHRRRGLARAVNLDALRRLRAAGAEHAIVLCRGGDEHPAARRLYESVGFRQHSRSVTFGKRL